MNALWNDIKYALRQLSKSPGFTAIALITLAFGIAANTVIFSAINGVLMSSLPVHNPDQLRIIGWQGSNISNIGGFTSDSSGRTESGQSYRLSFPYSVYRDFAEKAEGISDLFAFSYFEDGVTINVNGVAALADGLLVSGNFFSGYGSRILIGRDITMQDDRPYANPVAVISHRFWQRYYSCDPYVLGRMFTVNNVPFTIIGVLSQKYRNPLVGDPTDFYVPISTQPQLKPDEDWLAQTNEWWVRIMGRIDSEASELQARNSLELLFKGFLDTSESRMDEPAIVLEDGKRGLFMLYGFIAFQLTMLQGLVGLILLITCANIASLMLARGVARQHELSIRAALGAGWWRLIRLSLVESLLLSLAAGAIGLAAGVGIKAAVTNSISGFLAQTQTHLSYVTDHEAAGFRFDTGIDGKIFVFALGVTLLSTFIFGLIPALRAGRVNPLEGLKDNIGRTAPKLRLGKGLIATQIALSILLVFLASLLSRTVVNLREVDPGFDTENLLIFNLNPKESQYDGDNLINLYDSVREKIAGIPGVRSVALSQASHTGASFYTELSIPGRSNADISVPWYIISNGWLDTIGIRLLSGRDFNPSDILTSQPVAIINEAFAHKFFPEENPLGQLLMTGDEDEYQIVGLCSNHRPDLRDEEPRPILYTPNRRFASRMTFAVRSLLPPMSLVPAVRGVVAEIDPALPLDGITTQEQMLEESISIERLLSTFCGGLALLALFLSCIGLWGLMGYNVTRRTREIGVRIALGARPRDVAWSVLSEAIILACAGIAIGMPTALALACILRFVFFGIAPYDLVTMLISALVLITVAVVAAWIPARRAAKIDPMEALRYE